MTGTQDREQAQSGGEEDRKASRSLLGPLYKMVGAITKKGDSPNELLSMDDETIRENMENLRAILNTAADAIVTIDHHGQITAANPATTRMFGYEDDELIGKNVSILMPEPYRSEHGQYIDRYLKTGQARIIGKRRELQAQRKDGRIFPIELSVSEFHDGAGPMFTGIIHDISRRRELERHLADARVQEQQRVAQELHDGLGGQMTGIGMLVKAMLNRMQAEDSPYATQVAELARHLEDAHRQLRVISRGLSPVELLPDGLAKALEDLAASTDQTDDIRCAFRTDGVELHDPTVAAHLFRIAQEAVSNAVRHGLPSRIDIRLEREGNRVALTIANDGRSIQHLPDSGRGMGIRTMKYRSDVIDGTLRVTPAEGGGTVVICSVPNKQLEP